MQFFRVKVFGIACHQLHPMFDGQDSPECIWQFPVLLTRRRAARSAVASSMLENPNVVSKQAGRVSSACSNSVSTSAWVMDEIANSSLCSRNNAVAGVMPLKWSINMTESSRYFTEPTHSADIPAIPIHLLATRYLQCQQAVPRSLLRHGVVKRDRRVPLGAPVFHWHMAAGCLLV